MWELKEPQPVKLIVGILACDDRCLQAARDCVEGNLGPVDLESDVWPFEQTEYYKKETGPQILRQFLTLDKPINPSELAAVKLATNDLEKQLAQQLDTAFPRPANLDPGYIGLSKLVLATTKNYSHRIYIGQNIYAEVTLRYSAGWHPFDYTYPDYQLTCYHDFFTKVRQKLVEQSRQNP